MSLYQDRFGLYHDKDVGDEQLPSSNNGWIYTAFANQLGLYWPRFSTNTLYHKCMKQEYPLLITRLPEKEEPPMSRDEIIGMVSLGMLPNYILEMNYYQFHNIMDIKPKPWYKINYIKAIKDLWYLRNKHRNTIWQEGRLGAYPVAFRLSAADVYYVRKRTGQAPSLWQWCMFWLYAFAVVYFDGDERSDWSEKNILWLQLKDVGMEKNWIYKMIEKDRKATFIKYFGGDHVFVTLKEET